MAATAERLETLIPPEGWESVATPAETARYLQLCRIVSRAWQPLPHQVPPADEGWQLWQLWLLMAGRGAGKTDAGAAYFERFMGTHPNTRGRIIAPTLQDAREACVVGVSGIKAHNPEVRFNVNEGVLFWPNGSRARIFGASTPEDVERLRAGGNAHLDWWEELAAWRKLDDCLDQARFGLRLGSRPHAVATTTPKPHLRLKQLLSDPRTRVTVASTDANPYLDVSVRADLYERYAGTRLGRQELEAEYLTQVEGALWTSAQLEALRVAKVPQKRWLEHNDWRYADDLVRIVVGVDPATTSGPDSDETGIVVAGKGADGLGYVLADRSCRLSPDGWGRRAVQALLDYAADCIVVESNQGGQMCEQVIRTAAQSMGVPLPRVKLIHAVQGKRLRAEPVAALYEQSRIAHVLTAGEPAMASQLEHLEDQMTSYTVDSGSSPDRLDALVHGLAELMLHSSGGLRFRGLAA